MTPPATAPPVTLPPWLADRNVAVFDLETTGLDPEKDRITQIAVIHVNRGVEVASWCSLVNPGIPIPAEVTALTGITDDAVSVAPTFAELAREIRWRLGMRGAQRVLVTYNGNTFDSRFLAAAFLRDQVERALVGGNAEVVPEKIRVLDPLVLVRVVDRFVKGPGRHRLAVTAARWGVPAEKAHDALGDCRMTLGLMRAMGDEYGRIGVRSLEELWSWQEQRAAAQDKDFQEWKARQPPTPERAT